MPPAAERSGSICAEHDAGDPGVDQRLGARPGATGVVARLERDDSGRASGGIAGLRQRIDLGVRRAGAAVHAGRDLAAVSSQQDAADARIGQRTPDRAGRVERASHRADLGVGCHAFLRVVMLTQPGVPRRRCATKRSRRTAPRHMLLPSGLSPSVPEFHRLNRCLITRMGPRVADYHRRLGITPTPEHASKSCCSLCPSLAARVPLSGCDVRHASATQPTMASGSSALNTAEPATNVSAPASAHRSMVSRDTPPSTCSQMSPPCLSISARAALDLGQADVEELLAAEARLDRHDQHHVELWQQVLVGLDRVLPA